MNEIAVVVITEEKTPTFDAHVARTIAEKERAKEADRLFPEILDGIRASAEKGNLDCVITKSTVFGTDTRPAIKAKLEALGFKVSIRYHNGSVWEISW